MKQFCPNCGKELKSGATFCANCGHKIQSQKSVQPTSPAVQPTESTQAALPTEPKEEKKPQIFCPNCGHVLKPNAEFCSNCGYNLKTKQVPVQPAASPSQPTQAARQMQRAPKKPMKTRTKVLLSIFGVLIVAFIGFYAWGTHYYSRDNQIDRITTGLRDPNKDISQYVEANTPDMKVNNTTVKPLQNYYKEHQTAVTSLNTKFKDDEDTKNISLVQDGHYLLLFPKYKMQVKTYQPQVTTNHSNSTVTVNGKNIGGLSGSSGKYYKKLSLVFPGKYHFNVKSEVSGRTLTATSTANIWSNKTLDMDIQTQTFSVKSVPNGVVYINDKKVGTLDSKGEISFKDYPITRNMELYVVYNNKGKSIQSETVTDMADAFGSFDDDDYDYDDDDEDTDYNDDASDTYSDDVTKDDGNYVVEPKWKGVIATDDATDLLNSAFEDPSSDDFIDGSANSDYSDIKKMEKNWDNNDSIDSYDTDVDVESIYPASDNSCSIVFKVTYTFDNDDNTKTQVMEYTGGVIQKDGSDQKIKTIGKGKMISSKTEDN